ncbi:MAG: hypothetical protein Q4D43_10055, partial [Clostridia bacterium]|nr:hypothetical protein [Clostridia bacterium]
MHKLIWILALLMMLACAAQAEEYYCTQTDDLYYHVNASCGGLTGMTTLSAEDAKNSGKFPCPVCVPDDNKWQADIAAVARGNTIILRIADSDLAKPELTGVFGFSFPETVPVSEAASFLSEYLHGDDYNRALQEIESGSVDAIVRMPDILPIDADGQDALMIMNRRHIGNAWYYAIRPKDQVGDTWDMYWRINGLKLEMRDDEILLTFEQQTPESTRSLSVSPFSDSAAFSRLYDGCKVEVFADAGADVCANVAVITQFDADPDYMENSTLCIGDQVRVPVNGYMSGADGIFCCILTDAEYACLKNGAKAAVLPPDYMESASFENSPYAAVRKGTGGTGIVDQSGTFVVQPVYDYIQKPDAASFHTTIPLPFFCTDYDGALTVLDGASLSSIVQLSPIHGKIRAEYMNPSAFECYDDHGIRIISLTSGDTLMDIPYADDGERLIDGWYRYMADGYPSWLVQKNEYEASLVTLTGETVSESYPNITPLIWKGDRGAFLVAKRGTSNDQSDNRHLDGDAP